MFTTRVHREIRLEWKTTIFLDIFKRFLLTPLHNAHFIVQSQNWHGQQNYALFGIPRLALIFKAKIQILTIIHYFKAYFLKILKQLRILNLEDAQQCGESKPQLNLNTSPYILPVLELFAAQT